MKKLLLITAMLFCKAASAVTFLAIPEDGVHIFVDNKAECTGKAAAVVAALKPDASFQWMAAKVDDHGKLYQACATEYQGTIYLVYEDGDLGAVPSSMFHSVKDV